MDVQYNSSINTRQGMDAGYNNYNAAGEREDFFVSKGNEGVRDLQQIPIGKAFRGEVTNVVNNQVSIRLDNGQNVQARLAEPMNFNIGDKLLFQVKSNGEGMIEIKPLASALQGQEATILKALEAAQMPVNEKTVALLQNLLQEQMPINKNQLQTLYKQVLANSNADVKSIVQMNQLNIPVTKENVGQFEAYKNYEHRIWAEVNQLSEELPQLLEEISGENPQAGREFHLQLLSMFAGGEEQMFGEVQVSDAVNAAVLSETSDNAVLAQDGKLVQGDEAEQMLQAGADGQDGVAQLQRLQPEMSADSARAGFEQGQTGFELKFSERQAFVDALGDLPVSEELKGQILDGSAKVSDVLRELNTQLQQSSSFDVQDLVKNEGYHKLLKAQMNSQWFLKPQQIAEGERMEDFYTKLKAQAQQLESLLQSAGKGDSQAAKTVTGMKENINFMNEINQMFTYVQIPLMMSEQTAHSDLYVFTNKKNLRQQDGKVSALLHLDMESLGNLDVYVEMDGFDVRTQFKLADEDLVKLFEQNIDFLVQRIEEKGYKFSSKVEVTQEQVDFVEDFLQRDHGNVPMQRFAFDVRA